jgi:protein-disulfide isomerase
MRAIRAWWLMSLILVGTVSPAAAADLIYRPRPSGRSHEERVRLEEVLATADGQPLVKVADMQIGMALSYYHMALEQHRRELAWLRTRVEFLLLESAANRRGLTVTDLLKAEVKPGPVPEDRVAQLLKETDRPAGSQLTPQERHYLEQERLMVARRQYLDRLWHEAKISLKLSEPEPPLVPVGESAASPVLGPALSPVTIVEFCAFTSPQCQSVWVVLRDTAKRLGPQVRIVHRDSPVAQSPGSLPAALAARCAQRQGRFWAYADLLYANSEKMTMAALKEHAATLGLDGQAFGRCLDQQETAPEIEADLAEARRLGLPGLPALFINAVYVPVTSSPEQIARTIGQQVGQASR